MSSRPLLPTLVAFACIFAAQVSSNQNDQPAVISNVAVKRGRHLEVDLNETATEELLDKWMSQAVSGLMAAFASRRLEHVDEDAREALRICSKAALDVPAHARCVVKLMDAQKKVIKVQKEHPHAELKRKPEKKKEDVEWVGGFGMARAKRETHFEKLKPKIVNRPSYTLKSASDGTIMTKVARSLSKTVRAIKNKDRPEGWREAVGRVKKLGDTAKQEKKKRDAMKKRLKQMIDNTPPDLIDPRKPIALQEVCGPLSDCDGHAELEAEQACAKADPPTYRPQSFSKPDPTLPERVLKHKKIEAW
ncbi:unnamed protein product [Caenorhabditis auriculariae]|uniref:Uncharacterized protein n=1 Tax=Caenorhabditis auriculariae TaxID=2777116 RepID=A0A8S1HWU3_9PELO|nr:unnamed protein product [Caenorhabditis auriculariae]